MPSTKDKFPSRRYGAVEDYFTAYRDRIFAAWSTIDVSALARAATLLRDCIARDGVVYTCGNGGSAAIANHLLCDYFKGIGTGTSARPRVVSLSAHLELLTAIGNDIGYAEVFAHQLRGMARSGDVLLTISSSGDSENVVRAVSWAKQNEISVVALVGFSGGRCKSLADAAVHVAADNYGVVEDVHQSIMHILTQYLRQSMMEPERIGQFRF